MRKIIFLFVATLGLITTSCSEEKENPNKAEFNQLLEETMKIHDALMAEMGTINELRKSLGTPKPDQVKAYKEANAELKNSHKAMMDWMNEFSNEFPYAKDRLEGKTDAEIEHMVTRMKSQKKNVEELETAMKASIANAKKVLSE